MSEMAKSGYSVGEELGENPKQIVVTSCENCIFSEKDGNFQYGCKLGRLIKYRKDTEVVDVHYKYVKLIDVPEKLRPQGLTIKDVNHKWTLCIHENKEIVYAFPNIVSEPQTGEKAYYLIVDRLCNAYRDKNWRCGQPWISKDEKASIEMVQKEIELKMSIVVYLDKTHTQDDFLATLNSCTSQSILPLELIVLNNQKTIKVFDILSEKVPSTIAWRNNITIGAGDDAEYCFDSAMQYINGGYFTFIHAGTSLPTNFISLINKALNEDLKRFIMIESPDYLVAQTKVVKLLEGNAEIKPAEHDKFIKGISNKLKYFANTQKREELIKSSKEII